MTHNLEKSMPRLLAIALALAVLSAPAAVADTIQLTTATSVVAPLQWNPADAVSPSLVIALDNDTAPPADSLTSWQLRLIVVPSAEATGAVTFSGAQFPSDYLLVGNSSGNLGLILLGQELFASDFDDVDPVTGVPAASGASLLAIDFARSPDAFGRFDVYAVAGIGLDSFWSDQDFLSRTFGPEGNLYLGSVHIIPEPSTALLFIAAFSAIGLYRRWRIS